MNYIELFAGCGGLSLGLKAANGNMLLANELSPMAAETFAYNLLDENLDEFANDNAAVKGPLKTKWLSSNFGLDNLGARLRENPQEYPKVDGVCDLPSDGLGLEGSLIVGSIVQLNAWLNDHANQTALEMLRKGFGKGGVDLVSGGPPCQSFSIAGMREYSNSRNVLPWEFAKFVELIQPKFAILENVSGILRPFEVDEKKVYAWFEVAMAFAQIGIANIGTDTQHREEHGYIPLCLHVNAKHVGVAQSRTRFLMLAIRADVLLRLVASMPGVDVELMASSRQFYRKVRAREPVTINDLALLDAEKSPALFEGTFLESLSNVGVCSVKQAIDDLWQPGRYRSRYVARLDEYLGSSIRPHHVENHDLRSHGFDVQRRFRIYQVLSKVSAETASEALKILNRKATTLGQAAWDELREQDFYVSENRPFSRLPTKKSLEEYLEALQTGKHSQRALVASKPAPAALSIPDDTCHYHEHQRTLRTLTVREMARIQSFPDNFIFRSKVTTGGKQRKYEVPQYTQVGNAVPPLLGRALGLVIGSLIQQNAMAMLDVVPNEAEAA